MAVNVEKTEFQITAVDQASRVFKSTQGAIGSLQSSYIQLTGAILGGTAFTAFVAKMISTRAAVQDMADTTGDSVKTIDGLRRALAVSGTSMEQLGGALTRLGANLHSADDDGKAAGAAIKALGLDIDELRSKKPGEAFFELSKAMGAFEDGSAKIAAARALFGKSGPEMLKAMKDLAEAGELNGKMTAEQAAQADELEKNWRRLNVAFQASKSSMANEVIPYVSRMTEEMREGIRITGSLANALLTLGSINPFRSVRGNIENLQGEIAERTQRRERFSFLPDFMLQSLDAQTARDQQRIEFLKAQQRRAALDTLPPGVLDSKDAFARQKPRLEFTIPKPDRGGGAGQKDSGFDSLMEGLQKQLALQKESTEVEKINIELTRKRYELITPAQREELRTAAALLDVKLRERKAVEDQARYVDDIMAIESEREALRTKTIVTMAEQVETIRNEAAAIGKTDAERERATELMKLEKTLYDALRGVKEGDIETTSRLTAEYAKQRKALELALDDKEAKQTAEDRFQKYMQAQKEAARESVDVWHTAAKDMQRGMSSFFFDVMDGNLKNLGNGFATAIKRMVADAMAAKASIGLFGPNFSKGGDLGGLVGQGLDWLGIGAVGKGLDSLTIGSSASAFSTSPSFLDLGGVWGGMFAEGGRPPVGRLSLVGERGPELFMPDTAGTIIPNDALGGQVSVSYAPVFNVSGGDAGAIAQLRSEVQQTFSRFKREVVPMVTDAVRRGGSARQYIRG